MEFRETFDISHLEGPGALFPDEDVPELRPVMFELGQKTRELAVRFLRSLALSIGLVSL